MVENKEDLGVPASSGGRAATPSGPSPSVSGIAGIPNAAPFSPGPWRIEKSRKIKKSGAQGVYISSSSLSPREWVSFARVWVRIENEEADRPEGLANARLIAEAPAMFAALDELVSFINAHVPILQGNPLVEAAKSALSRVRGEGG